MLSAILVLRVGAFGSFFIMLAGLLVGLFVQRPAAIHLERAGASLTLGTPVVRVWLREYRFCAKDTGSTGQSRSVSRFYCSARFSESASTEIRKA